MQPSYTKVEKISKNVQKLQIATAVLGSLSVIFWVLKCTILRNKYPQRWLVISSTNVIHYLYRVFVSLTTISPNHKMILACSANMVIIYGVYTSMVETQHYWSRTPQMDIQLHIEPWIQQPDMMLCLHGRNNKTAFAPYPIFNSKLWEFTFFWTRIASVYLIEQSLLFLTANFKYMESLGTMDDTYKNYSNDQLVSLFKSMSPKCPDYVLFCVNRWGKTDCCRDAEHTLTSLGVCAVIHGLNQTQTHEANEILIQIPDVIYEVPSIGVPLNDGIRLRFRDPVNLQYDTKSVLMSAGFHTQIKINKVTRSTRMNVPNHRCESEINYTEESCELNCLTSYAVERCNCTSLDSWNKRMTYNGSAEVRICTTKNDVQCFADKMVYVFRTEKFSEQMVTGCNADCLMPCKSTSYDTTVSYARLTKDIIRRFDLSQVNDTNRLIHLSIVYGNLEITSETEKYTSGLENVFSNIGGTLGAYIGYSVTTVLKILTTLLVDLVSYIRSKLIQ